MNALQIVEIATAFVIGVALIALSCWLLKFRLKSFAALVFNSIGGAIILIALNVFGIVALPVNPINMLIVGYMGIFGAALIFFIITFL